MRAKTLPSIVIAVMGSVKASNVFHSSVHCETCVCYSWKHLVHSVLSILKLYFPLTRVSTVIHSDYRGLVVSVYKLKPRNVDFAACQWSVQCSKPGENLLGNAKIGGLTPPALLSRSCFFRLSFVSIDGTRPGSSAFPLLWRSQKMDRFVDRLKRRIIFSRWYSKIVRKIKKSNS